MIDCTELSSFKQWYGLTDQLGRKHLISDWYNWPHIDKYNLSVCALAKQMCKGMSYDTLCGA